MEIVIMLIGGACVVGLMIYDHKADKKRQEEGWVCNVSNERGRN